MGLYVSLYPAQSSMSEETVAVTPPEGDVEENTGSESGSELGSENNAGAGSNAHIGKAEDGTEYTPESPEVVKMIAINPEFSNPVDDAINAVVSIHNRLIGDPDLDADAIGASGEDREVVNEVVELIRETVKKTAEQAS